MKFPALLVALIPGLCTCLYVTTNEVADTECNLPVELVNEIKSYEETAKTIINSLTYGKYKVGR